MLKTGGSYKDNTKIPMVTKTKSKPFMSSKR
jgi:hypothetical protein